MARIVPFNRTGIIGLETVDAVLSGNNLTFVFENHPYVNSPFNGLLLVHFKNPAPQGTTATSPIFFETRGLAGSRKPVTKNGGVPLVAEDIKVPSYNLFFYDFTKGVVEAVAAVPGVI